MIENPHKVIRSIFRMRKMSDICPRVARYSRKKLGDLFKELKYNKGAEIGVRLGQFSEILCAKNPGVEHYAIDMWTGGRKAKQIKEERIYRKAVKRLSPFNVTFLRMTSMEAVKQFDDNSLDYVYIDANHTFDHCCSDIIYWSAKVRKGGIVACHDYSHNRMYGVVSTVNVYTHCHRIEPWYITREVIPTAFWVKSW